MRAILQSFDVELLARPTYVPDVDETGVTLEENALLKAWALVDATGSAAIADDTGLFVDALEGRPGVRSARYAGDGASDHDNVTKLLDELAHVDLAERTAHFRCVVAVAYPDGTSFCVEGVLDGVIAEVRGGDQGFGYDPVFRPLASRGRTLAEMSPAEKNEVSHRGRALRALAEKLV